MSQRPAAVFLLLVILVSGGLLIFVLDMFGIVTASDYLPFISGKNPVKVEDKEYPTEVEKLRIVKMQEALTDREEKIARQEDELHKSDADLKKKQDEINEMRKSLEDERKKLQMLTRDWNDRQKKIKDIAVKVGNMPPDKAQEMLANMPDFDVIEIIRQMDKNAEADGVQSITSYLLTLFKPERRADIARKMLLPPMDDSETTEATP